MPKNSIPMYRYNRNTFTAIEIHSIIHNGPRLEIKQMYEQNGYTHHGKIIC